MARGEKPNLTEVTPLNCDGDKADMGLDNIDDGGGEGHDSFNDKIIILSDDDARNNMMRRASRYN